MRCSALDNQGRQCKKLAVMKVHYFGENEIYDWHGPETTWVLVGFCREHLAKDAKPHKEPEK